MQIMYENLTITGRGYYKGGKRYCDNIGTDQRRTVSVRTSTDGVNWSNDAGSAAVAFSHAYQLCVTRFVPASQVSRHATDLGKMQAFRPEQVHYGERR